MTKKIRQRPKTVTGGERKTGSEYMEYVNEEIAYGKWTEEENFIFLQHVMLKPELLTENNSDVVLNELTRNFNANLLQAEEVFRNGHANSNKKQAVGISSIRRTTSTIFSPIAPVRQQKRRKVGHFRRFSHL